MTDSEDEEDEKKKTKKKKTKKVVDKRVPNTSLILTKTLAQAMRIINEQKVSFIAFLVFLKVDSPLVLLRVLDR